MERKHTTHTQKTPLNAHANNTQTKDTSKHMHANNTQTQTHKHKPTCCQAGDYHDVLTLPMLDLTKGVAVPLRFQPGEFAGYTVTHWCAALYLPALAAAVCAPWALRAAAQPTPRPCLSWLERNVPSPSHATTPLRTHLQSIQHNSNIQSLPHARGQRLYESAAIQVPLARRQRTGTRAVVSAHRQAGERRLSWAGRGPQAQHEAGTLLGGEGRDEEVGCVWVCRHRRVSLHKIVNLSPSLSPPPNTPHPRSPGFAWPVPPTRSETP